MSKKELFKRFMERAIHDEEMEKAQELAKGFPVDIALPQAMGFQAGYDAAMAECGRDWISVEDHLPDTSTPMENNDVWAYYTFDFPKSEYRQGICRYYKDFDIWRSINSPSEVIVSFWMPLPEPPHA